MPAPPATGVRITWSQIPGEVRQGVERILGGRVVDTESQAGGFSPGTADRVGTEHGRRAFVKAVSPGQNADSPDLLRQEADHLVVLGRSPYVPELIGRYDDGHWIAVIMEEIDGRCPSVPWNAAHVEGAMAMLAALAAELTPSPLPGLQPVPEGLVSLFAGWRQLQAMPDERIDPWVAAHLEELALLSETTLSRLRGDTVVHCDVRADNLLVRADGSMVVVDWPWAMVGPAWLDRLLLMINIDLYGGHDVEELIRRHLGDVEPELIDGTLAGLCAYFTDAGRQDPVPGLPTLRGFQQAQADSTTAWLRRRLSGRRR
ncbi:MAG TPA: phosphotransferase, partial [Microlunatus sp.]|nr:phosphotransferase [Microlunatus sp.]